MANNDWIQFGWQWHWTGWPLSTGEYWSEGQLTGLMGGSARGLQGVAGLEGRSVRGLEGRHWGLEGGAVGGLERGAIGTMATRSWAATGDDSREIEDNMSHSTKGTIMVYPTVLIDMNTLTIQGVTATSGPMATLTSGLMATATGDLMATGHQFPVCL